MNYKTSKSLEGKTLKFGDTVTIILLSFKVMGNYLSHCEMDIYNSEIFLILNIKDKISFCEKHYGCLPEKGDFPKSRNHDYSALTRVAVALLETSENALKGKKISSLCRSSLLNKLIIDNISNFV